MDSADETVEDIESQLTSLSDAFFRAVSFRAGEEPDYGRIYGLFIEGGLLIRNTSETPEVSTVGQFIAARRPLLASGRLTCFEETGVGFRTEVFGRVAHRLTSYLKRAVTEGVESEVRGVISTQFVRTPSGWRMSSMAWDDERAGLTIPELA